jgi:hypothetical protein
VICGMSFVSNALVASLLLLIGCPRELLDRIRASIAQI